MLLCQDSLTLLTGVSNEPAAAIAVRDLLKRQRDNAAEILSAQGESYSVCQRIAKAFY